MGNSPSSLSFATEPFFLKFHDFLIQAIYRYLEPLQNVHVFYMGFLCKIKMNILAQSHIPFSAVQANRKIIFACARVHTL